MNQRKCAITLAIYCCTILTTATTASAEYVGVTTVNKTDPATEFLCNQGNGNFVPGPLTVCNVFAEFDNPDDRLLVVGLADITTSDPLGYFQHAVGSDVLPACNLLPQFPDLICDSFITIGVKCSEGNQSTAIDPDFDADEFNDNGHVVGGWFNANPLNGQGDAGNYPDLRVLFLQLSVSPGESSTGTIGVFAKIDDEIVAFLNQAVDCVAVGGCQDPEDCDDGNDCTDDFCDPETGCFHENVEQTLIIKQGACPAPVNPNGNGVIPILLVGDDGFDVNNIDLDSLALRRCDGEGDPATPLADHTQVKDLNHPGDSVGCGECQCNDDQSSDGIDDLSMKFRTDTTLAALGLGAGDSATLELTGTMLDGTPFCARDCIVVVPPGTGTINATMESNVFDTFIEVTPLDLNVDSDGFADFSRAYIEGTTITLTAPSISEGRRFLRWSVNGEMQGFGSRTIDVTISEETTLKAFYVQPRRVIPELPTEGSGDMD